MYIILMQVQLFFILGDLKMTCIYLIVITTDNDIGMYHNSQSLHGFTYNVIIFNKTMCMYYMVQKQKNVNLDCSYYETYTYKNFSGILYACNMVNNGDSRLNIQGRPMT